MAATRLIAMHKNKGCSVAQCLADRTAYALDDEKTEEGTFVSSYACNPAMADAEFLDRKKEYMELTGRQYKGDIIAYQIRQSFKPGEITPEEANKIGYETAMRFTKGEHAFFVATHTDRKHIHNHIIFDSVNLHCDRKFRDSWFCGLGLQRLSDIICMEHGLSVIQPAPFGQRAKKPKYEKSYRQEIREEVDKVLEHKPQTFEQFLQMLVEDDYEIKRKKHLAIKARERNNFIRFKSLGDGYREEDIRAAIEENAPRIRKEKYKKREFDLLIDIQEKLKQGKGESYVRWGKRFNAKAVMRTILYLDSKGVRGYEDLTVRAESALKQFQELTDTIKSTESRMEEISRLRKQIFNYAKTRDTYIAYKKSGYSKKFLEEHREEITLHNAARAAFNQLDGDLPKIKELNQEFAMLLAKKKSAYGKYKAVKEEMKEMTEAKRNIDMFLEADRATDRQEKKRQKSQNADL